MSKRYAILWAAATLALLAPRLQAQDPADAGTGADAFSDEGMSVYGYAVSYAALDFLELPSEEVAFGGIAYLRAKGDFKPQEGLSFHVEASFDARTGYQNPFVVAAGAGLSDPNAPAYLSSIEVDQAYMSAISGTFSLQAGKVPIGWGSGYVFNPTQRASRTALLDPVSDETPGTLSILPAWSPSDAFRASGYLAFQDKSHRETVAAEDGELENLPFGLRLQTTIGNFDLSACFLREVDYVENGLLGTAAYERAVFAGLDAAGAVWDLGVYAEAALELPLRGDDFSWEADSLALGDALELAAGFDYLVPGLELGLRAEYYHQGSGARERADYDLSALLSGKRSLLAEDYLFARAERIFADYLTLSAAALANLNDRGIVAMAELAYEAMDNLELKLGGTFPWGPSGSEFEGRHDLTALGLGEIDVMRPSAYASCKLSF